MMMTGVVATGIVDGTVIVAAADVGVLTLRSPSIPFQGEKLLIVRIGDSVAAAMPSWLIAWISVTGETMVAMPFPVQLVSRGKAAATGAAPVAWLIVELSTAGRLVVA
jgi:hypothetical protein